MALLYADECFDADVVDELRLLGQDVLTAQEAGQANQGIDDPEVLDFAIQLGRAVLTFDRLDFKRLHRRARPHTGIIVCTNDANKKALAQRIHLAVSPLTSLASQLIRIYRPSTP
jgi:predicted nuclease of predicted toxin-antitoxin system